MADLKEMIISTLPHGKETLNEINVLRKNGHDYRLEKGKPQKIIKRLNNDNL